MTLQESESDGSDPSLTLTSDNSTSEPREGHRTKDVLFSLLGPNMLLLACTGHRFCMFMYLPGCGNKRLNFGYTCVIRL